MNDSIIPSIKRILGSSLITKHIKKKPQHNKKQMNTVEKLRSMKIKWLLYMEINREYVSSTKITDLK
jgi:hypothetical protein